MKHWEKIKIAGDKIFFTADLHLGHENVISYCKRPFKDVSEMDEFLIDSWNSTVPKDGLVFVLGDFCFGKSKDQRIPEILSNLNGEKQLILGNHDSCSPEDYKNFGFSRANNYREILVDKQLIVLSHFPMIAWKLSNRNSWMLHGHCHGTINYLSKVRKKLRRDDPLLPFKIFDVGVDTNKNFQPYSFEEIKKYMTQLDIEESKGNLTLEDVEMFTSLRWGTEI